MFCIVQLITTFQKYRTNSWQMYTRYSVVIISSKHADVVRHRKSLLDYLSGTHKGSRHVRSDNVPYLTDGFQVHLFYKGRLAFVLHNGAKCCTTSPTLPSCSWPTD